MIRRYIESDYPSIAAWYAARGELPPQPDMLPVAGFLEPGVGALFLYRTDSAIALAEGLIMNPEAAGRAQSRAVTDLTKAVVLFAGLAGYRHVLGLVRTAAMERRVKRLGFRSVGSFRMLEAQS